MNNIEVITAFFEAFERLDYGQMNDLYVDDIIYSDPLFGLLQGPAVKDRWELICTSVKDFHLTIFKTEAIDGEYATCSWQVDYFSVRLHKQIVFSAKTFMKIVDGAITEHSEGYNLTQWIGKAYGLKGRLFGWTNFMKRKVQKEQLQALERFSKSKNLLLAGKKRRHISDAFDQ
ncbi:MAG: nuclear transport factor 2 family protein [Niabella sp.]|nr:nuclear transport factor 2 family protein [Niabella sp.]